MWGSDEQDSNEQQDNNTQQSGSDLLEPVKVLNDIDQKFNSLYNSVINNLNDYNLHSSKMQSIAIQDLSKSLNGLKTETVVSDGNSDEIKKLLNADNNDIIGNLKDFSIPNERKERYGFYDEIPNVNYIAHRMLKVYLDNILIKNVQTKKILNISENDNNSFFLNSIKDDIGKHYNNFIKTAIVFFDIQKKLKDTIAPNMLKYGNVFVEVLNFKKLESAINSNNGFIEESSQIFEEPTLITECITDGYIDGNSDNKAKGTTYCLFEHEYFNYDELKTSKNIDDQLKSIMKHSPNIIQEDYSSYMQDLINQDNKKDEEYAFDDINDLDFNEMNNIYLKTIMPNQVIIVEYDDFLYGYLVIEDIAAKEGTEVDIFKRFTQQENSASNNNEQEIKKEIVERMTKGIVRKLNHIIKTKHHGHFKFDNFNFGEDVEDSIKVILYNKIKSKSKLKFRFVSSDKMVNFSTNVDKFGPYGTSIFDPIIQPVKMYTLALMSSIVSRLSRASVVRKWTVEAGNKKNHAEIIEKVKKDINNKSISFDSLSNIKNISQNITDFRDIATIQVNGQRFIDMEVMPMGDRSLPLNDLNDLRSELIASTGIPSVYLNIGDQVDLRESLVSLNTSFATTVSSYQANIDEGMNQLMNIIFNTVLENNSKVDSGFSLSNYYKLSLNPPLILTVQANEALVSSVSNIIGMLKSTETAVDPVQLLKLYIPQMNWEDLVKTGKTFIKRTAKEQLMGQQDDQQM